MSDLIIIPELDDPGVITKQAELRLRRHVDHQLRQGNLSKVMNMKRLRARMRLLRMQAARGAYGRGASGMLSTGRAALANPYVAAAAVAAVVVAAIGVTAIRIATDKPFETWGYELEEFFLGDLPVEARAAIEAREGTIRVPGFAAAMHADDPYIKKRFDMLKSMGQDYHRGKRMFHQKIGVNNMADHLIMKAKESFVSKWKEKGLAERAAQARDLSALLMQFASPFRLR